jgi:hypothetical protein
MTSVRISAHKDTAMRSYFGNGGVVSKRAPHTRVVLSLLVAIRGAHAKSPETELAHVPLVIFQRSLCELLRSGRLACDVKQVACARVRAPRLHQASPRLPVSPSTQQ